MADAGCGCFGSTPYCNTSGVCVGCLDSSQCPTNQVCNTNNDPGDAGDIIPVCIPSCDVAGGTVCTDDLKCNPSTGLCVQCVGPENCTDSSAPYCSPGGSCVQCLTNPDCVTGTEAGTSSTPVCAPGGYCVQCVKDTDCNGVAGAPYCSSFNMCVECTNPSQCPASKPGCMTLEGIPEGTCGGCSVNTDCNPGTGCYSPFPFPGFYMGTCETLCGYQGAVTPDGGTCAPCASNADCAPAGEACDTSTGYCG